MKPQSYLILLSVFLFNSVIYSQVFEDIISPVKLTGGITDSILVTDLFYSDNYDLSFGKVEDIDISYNSDDKILVMTPSENIEGLTLLEFTNDQQKYYLPLIINQKLLHSFTYKPSGTPQQVNLFGSFNSWNREEFPMKDDDGNGTYEITVPIEPGRYEYKFFVDGKEYFDPVNEERISNGMGDYNSLVTVKPRHSGDFSLHIVSSELKDDHFQISFFLDNDFREIAFTKDNIFCFLDNQLIKEIIHSIEGTNYTVKIPSEMIEGNKTFRTIVTQGGRVSNLQTIKFINGKPAGGDTWLWDDAIIYSLMIDRFYDGDKTNSIAVEHPELKPKANYMGGDFKGVIKKLEEGYFDSLGINTIWISPVVENTNEAFQEYPAPHRYYTGYHGYWPVSSVDVEEKFGDMDLLKELIKKAREKNIKILLDYVAHHVHIEHPLWESNPEWFGTLDLPDGRKNLRIWDEHRLTTWFEPYLPSFDFSKSSDALKYMTENAVWWLKETGADGFRHDAVKHVPNSFWRELTRKIKDEVESERSKKVYQIGETFGSYELVSSYVNNGQLDAQFNFILYDTAVPVFSDSTVPFRYLDEQMHKTFSVYGNNHLMGNVIDSHDKVRFMAYADGDITPEVNSVEIGWENPPQVDNISSYKKLQMAMAYLLSVPGLPIIYYGDEIGMSGAADPDNRRMMRFEGELKDAEKSNKKMVSDIIKIRREHPALRYGDYHTLYVDDKLYSYMRSDVHERVVVVLNKSTSAKEINLGFPEVYNIKRLVPLIEGENITVNEDNAVITMEPLSYRFYVAE